MSIHPRFAHALMRGEKRVEFRRRSMNRDITHVIVYATAPDRRVVGVLEIDHLDISSPKRLWRRHRHVGAISRAEFDRYFHGVDEGVAIVVKRSYPVETTIPLAELGAQRPPQSFQYVTEQAAAPLLSVAGCAA